jgi:hypothetical protein
LNLAFIFDAAWLVVSHRELSADCVAGTVDCRHATA